MSGERARVYVGTVGQSIWRSDDDGDTFRRASGDLFSECDVRALVLYPQRAEALYAGTDRGCYWTENAGETWSHLPSPLDGRQTWSLAIDGRRPETLYAGTCPAAIFRSRDAGRTWEELDADLPERCEGTMIIPRVTCIVIDAEDPRRIYAGVEIGGVRRSRDGGDSWQTLTIGLSSQDIHGLAIAPRSPRALLATTNNDVNRSRNDGDTWEPLSVRDHFPWPYCRAIAPSVSDPDLLYVGAGNGPPGDQGGLFRTRDQGESWERLPLPATANSTIWSFASHPADTGRLYAASVSGQIFRSRDAGETWEKLPREFGEIRALAWEPGWD